MTGEDGRRVTVGSAGALRWGDNGSGDGVAGRYGGEMTDRETNGL